jgi:hypothetical protein
VEVNVTFPENYHAENRLVSRWCSAARCMRCRRSSCPSWMTALPRATA